MNNIALTHKTSDVVSVKVETEPSGHKVLEIEFRFIRYRLLIDDEKAGQDIQKALSEAVKPKLQDPGRTRMPQFYRGPK